ncbi:MAG TPA: ABC transporter permease, partial [Pirellulaceae bacterium]
MATRLGFVLTPVKQQAREAAAGTTPFEALFLGFSLFLLASATLLVFLLISLSLERRLPEFGVLQACGWTPRSVGWLLWMELLLVTIVGASWGIALGVGYAAVLVHGLRTWWVAAIVDPFVELDCPPRTLGLAFLAVILICGFVAWRAVRRAARTTPRELWTPTLRAGVASSQLVSKWGPLVAYVGFMTAAMLGGWRANGEMRAAWLLGAGAASVALGVWWHQRSLMGRIDRALSSTSTHVQLTLQSLARASAARHRLRSLSIVALTASAAFLLVSVAAFRQRPTRSGTGGFDIVAVTTRPVFEELEMTGDDQGNHPNRTEVKQGADAPRPPAPLTG